MVAAGALLTSIKFNGALVMQVHGDGPVKLMVVECLAGGPRDPRHSGYRRRRHRRRRDDARPDQPARPRPRSRSTRATRCPGNSRTRASSSTASRWPSGSRSSWTLTVACRRRSRQRARCCRACRPKAARRRRRTPTRAARSPWHTIADEIPPKLPPDAVLHRLFWQETLQHYPAMSPHFACTCSRERIGRMLVSLGGASSIIDEQGTVTVTCDFCNRQYTFDAVDVHQPSREATRRRPTTGRGTLRKRGGRAAAAAPPSIAAQFFASGGVSTSWPRRP